MKYLFIILIAFSFIGCNSEDDNQGKVVYATFTLLSNPDEVIQFAGMLGSSLQQELGPNATALPVGTSVTTEPYVIYLNNVTCNVTMQSLNFAVSSGQNCEVEIKLYVDDDLFETRVVTGSNNYNFIVP